MTNEDERRIRQIARDLLKNMGLTNSLADRIRGKAAVMKALKAAEDRGEIGPDLSGEIDVTRDPHDPNRLNFSVPLLDVFDSDD
ncbi:hypothetical protein LCGC14_2404730 [marine sediment metagenome]|uniref:Uncharacterized protein n=1 Tax=marine sediment metagenome TaxID=412755 RepID=A0A0F9BUD7_9ZZZZ